MIVHLNLRVELDATSYTRAAMALAQAVAHLREAAAVLDNPDVDALLDALDDAAVPHPEGEEAVFE